MEEESFARMQRLKVRCDGQRASKLKLQEIRIFRPVAARIQNAGEGAVERIRDVRCKPARARLRLMVRKGDTDGYRAEVGIQDAQPAEAHCVFDLVEMLQRLTSLRTGLEGSDSAHAQ